MSLSITEITVLIITIAFGMLVVIFLIQAFLRKRYAWALFSSLVFGFLAGFAAILGEINLTGDNTFQVFARSLHLNLYGFHFFFFYIFFERLISKKPNPIRLSIAVALLLTQTIGLWLVFYFEVNAMNSEIAWVLADIGYWTPALLVYLGFGVPIYIKTYVYTKEIKAIVLCVALIFVSIGFIISMINDLYFILDVFKITINAPDVIAELSEIANIFPSVGVILFVATYLVNIDYIYRLPNDNYLLMVLTKEGNPIHSVNIKTRRDVQIKDLLLSGMIYAINSVFKEILQRQNTISSINSEGINIIIEQGEEIVVLVITDRETYFLNQGLKRYTKKFETTFKNELRRKEQNILVYNKAIDLLKSIFPFFIIEERDS